MATAGPRHATALTVIFALSLYGAPWIVGLKYADRDATAPVWLALNMAAIPFMAMFVIAAEQLAVALVVHALGDRVAHVSIGVGPVVVRGRVSACTVAVCAVPFSGGNAILTTRREGQVFRTGVATLAGLAAIVGILVLTLKITPHSAQELRAGLASTLALDTLLIMVAAGNCFAAFVNAISMLSSSEDDALQRTRRNVGIALEAERCWKRGAYVEAEAWARRGLREAPDDPYLLYALAQALSGRRDEGVFETVKSLLEREIPPELLPACQNLWAWECYVRRREDLRAEADRAADAALKACPDDPSVLDTRGHVSLWNGRFDEAERTLLRAHELAKNASTRASSALGLAILHAHADRGAEATTWLARARAADPDHRLMARAIAAVEPLRRT